MEAVSKNVLKIGSYLKLVEKKILRTANVKLKHEKQGNTHHIPNATWNQFTEQFRQKVKANKFTTENQYEVSLCHAHA